MRTPVADGIGQIIFIAPFLSLQLKQRFLLGLYAGNATQSCGKHWSVGWCPINGVRAYVYNFGEALWRQKFGKACSHCCTFIMQDR
jgi:hypothetical protein